jgi:hypothetical protein
MTKFLNGRQIIVKFSHIKIQQNLSSGLGPRTNLPADGQTWSPHKTLFVLYKERLIKA